VCSFYFVRHTFWQSGCPNHQCLDGQTQGLAARRLKESVEFRSSLLHNSLNRRSRRSVSPRSPKLPGLAFIISSERTSLGETPHSYVLRRRLELARTSSGLILGAIKLSRATYRKMIQKLVWASAYSLVAIPVAGGLLVRWGLHLPMSVGAVAMSLSTIIVAANAQLLRQLKLQRLSL
jgi:hypothetical protein